MHSNRWYKYSHLSVKDSLTELAEVAHIKVKQTVATTYRLGSKSTVFPNAYFEWALIEILSIQDVAVILPIAILFFKPQFLKFPEARLH